MKQSNIDKVKPGDILFYTCQNVYNENLLYKKVTVDADRCIPTASTPKMNLSSLHRDAMHKSKRRAAQQALVDLAPRMRGNPSDSVGDLIDKAIKVLWEKA
jgi:hypothetical protein